jgi:hypothetical protein
MINLILAGGFSLSSLPMILLGILIIVLFLALLWYVLSKAPAPIAEWAKVIVIVLGGILLLWFLISLYTGDAVFSK